MASPFNGELIHQNNDNSQHTKPLPNGKKFHVFISYSESDRSWVGTVIQHLQNDYNFKCFEHSADFIPGKKITENIEYAMSNSVKTMFILTEEYYKSYWCQYEVEFAIIKLLAEMKENVIIPVLKEDCEIPGYLRPFTYVNATGDINVWLPRLVSAMEAEGVQYNHDVDLTRVKDAVNRHRNLEILYKEKSQFSCSDPVFKSKYVPTSLSKDPVNINQQLYHDIIQKLSSSLLVKGRHCRNLWWPTTFFWAALFVTMNGFGMTFVILSVHYLILAEKLDEEHAKGKELDTTAEHPLYLYIVAGVVQSIGLFTIMWSIVCCYSEYKGKRQTHRDLREMNKRLLPSKVLVAYRRQRFLANFTIYFLFYDMTQCVNHIALEIHNRRIRQRQNGGEMEFIMNDGDDVHLLDDTTERSMNDDLQENITEHLLDLSSAYLMEYMNERLDLPIDSIRHASQAKCLCQFAESNNTDLDNVINV
ncbi:uncharacterized protein LOC127725344 [Mytilus californianus]|uniref:uncharacterized protein LOC127725344 n=1 Tax=Mytilus californianus TaxID=6549 RepID=UPI0022464DDF|nr:uncharacterized protein LOC127725344 [Mytilus californianus]